VGVAQDTVIDIALDSALSSVASLKIPSGALAIQSGPAVTAVTVGLRPVAENRMRYALSVVHPTRVNKPDFKYARYLSFAQTVVSPAFECNVPSNIKEPFAVNWTVTSLVDNNRRTDTNVWVEDICLARLEEVGQFRAWRCLFTSQYDRRLICPESADDCKPGKYIVRNPATDAPPENQVKSVINLCTSLNTAVGTRAGYVYAFITAPLATYVSPGVTSKDIVQANIVGVILGVIFGILFLLFLLYLAFRLFRYRKKYHEEKDEADRLKEEVENMQQFGGEAGNRDDQVNMTENPLAAQLAHLQQAVKEEDVKLQEAEQHLKVQEADIRKDHIENMRSNRDKMLAELERLKKQLSDQSASQNAPSQIDDNETTSGGWNQGGGGGDGGAYKAGFDQYQAPRGGPKKKEF